MPFSFRCRLALSAGVFSLGAAALVLPTPAAASSGCASPGIPALAVSPGRAPHVTGSVLVAGAGRRVTVKSSRRSHASVTGTTWLEFCLRPRTVAKPVTLLAVQPGSVSVALARGGRLTLSGRRTAATVASGRRARLVQVLLDRRKARASLFVGGQAATSVPAAIAATVRVSVGASAAAGPAAASTTAALTAAAQTPTAFAASAPAAPAKTATNTTTTATGAKAATGTTTSTTPTPTPAGVTAAVAGGASAWPATNPFSPTSFWNARLASNAPLDPNSATYVNDLNSQIKQYGAWMNTTWYSVPVYVVPANQPTVKVTLETWGPDLQAAWNAVPIPPGAVAAKGTDESMSVWQPSTDKMWDFWLAQQVNGQWEARWGGEMDNVSTSPGYFTHSAQTNNWGGTATGLALAGGLITLADLQRGYINHALALAVPQTLANQYSWPAQRTDGKSTAATALPEGIRFRLNPSISCPGLKLTWLDTLLCQAMQTYGVVVRDTSGAVTLYAQDPTATGTNPWAAPFDGWSEGTFLSWLPWNQLQALKTQMSG
jgi:hypothetical protein